MYPDSLISICRSERKVICTPLFRKRREIRGHIGLAHARNRRSHGIGWRCTWCAPTFHAICSTCTVWRWSRRTWPQRGAVGAGQVEQHVEQHGIMVEPAGQIIADVGIIGIAACGELRQCQMLAYQQRDPADDVAVESHAFHDHGRMPSAFRRMVGHPRSFADVMQDAGEQQRPRNAGRRTAHRWVFHGRAA